MLPRFADNKSEMVAAGVIPIDRLTNVREPVEVVTQRCGRSQLEAVYGLRLATPAPQIPPTAQQLLLALANSRGWGAGGGLPDEARAGRQILKDYVSGKLLFCRLPPGHIPEGFAPMQAPLPHILEGLPINGGHAGPILKMAQALPPAITGLSQSAVATMSGGGSSSRQPPLEHVAGSVGASSSGGASSRHVVDLHDWTASEVASISDTTRSVAGTDATPFIDGYSVGDVEDDYCGGDNECVAGDSGRGEHEAPAGADSTATAAAASADDEGGDGGDDVHLTAADLELLEELEGGSKKNTVKRPEYKFNKKVARTKGSRGLQQDEGGYDGQAMATGKKGGIVRVAGYS